MGCPSPRDADDGIRALGPCLELEEAEVVFKGEGRQTGEEAGLSYPKSIRSSGTAISACQQGLGADQPALRAA